MLGVFPTHPLLSYSDPRPDQAGVVSFCALGFRFPAIACLAGGMYAYHGQQVPVAESRKTSLCRFGPLR